MCLARSVPGLACEPKIQTTGGTSACITVPEWLSVCSSQHKRWVGCICKLEQPRGTAAAGADRLGQSRAGRRVGCCQQRWAARSVLTGCRCRHWALQSERSWLRLASMAESSRADRLLPAAGCGCLPALAAASRLAAQQAACVAAQPTLGPINILQEVVLRRCMHCRGCRAHML